MSEDVSDDAEPAGDAFSAPAGVGALGVFIKRQRRLAEMSQRELARLADVSDAYLSQLERGLHEPSIRVVNGLSQALNMPADSLLRYLGATGARSGGDRPSTEDVILADERLTEAQRQSLIDVYRAFITANGRPESGRG